MARKEIICCDGCGKEGLAEPVMLEVTVGYDTEPVMLDVTVGYDTDPAPGETTADVRELHLCGACARVGLGRLLAALSDGARRAWYEGMRGKSGKG